MTKARLCAAASIVSSLVVCGLTLSACDRAASIERVRTRQMRLDPPRLWLAELLGPTGVVNRSVWVCADGNLRNGFVRADPEVNGEPCRATSKIISKPGLHSMRCEAVGQAFAVYVTSRGDPASDFTVRYTLKALDTGRGPLVQTVRYRRLGACPAGWRVGDRAQFAPP